MAQESKKEIDKERLKDSFKIIDFKDYNVSSNGYSNYQQEEDMKGITKRKDGLYMIRKTIKGVVYTKYARNINEAKKIRTQLNKKPCDNSGAKKYTLITWNKEWLEMYKKPFVVESTFKQIVQAMERVIKIFHDIRLKDISTLMIQEFFNKMARTRTKEKTYTYFNACLQKAEDLSLIKKNPFKGVIKDKKIKFKNDSFVFAEQEKILKALKGTRIEHEIYIYLLTGCRPNELPANENFDFINNLITINGTKTECAKRRLVEMTPEFSEYIKPYIEKGDRLPVSVISKDFKELCGKLEINKPLIYRLRHTFATNHFSLKTSPKKVQSWLGHSSISLTLDIYTDIDKTATKEKIEKLYNNFYYTES